MMKFSLPNKVPNLTPSTDGWVFIGTYPMTAEDVQDLYDFMQSSFFPLDSPDDLVIDQLSVVGTYDANYTSYYYYNTGKQPPGGKGSTVYENQHVGSGVKFAKEPIYYTDADTNEFQYGMPPDSGAYYEGIRSAISGPKPSSEAEHRLGDGHYEWDEENAWYIIVK